MKVAFYAPLKSPDFPVPSGDRRMARLLIAALEKAGHAVDLASSLRAYDSKGDLPSQQAIKAEAERQAMALLEVYHKNMTIRPDVWFTYHLYYKAPDWIGPIVTKALNIPYIIAEASYAPKRAGGPWDLGHRATAHALHNASLVINLNQIDADCARPVLGPTGRMVEMAPFIDTTPYETAASERRVYRAMTASQYNIEPSMPWLLSVAMMREGDKLESYRQLGAALQHVKDRPWRLLIVGDGPAKASAATALYHIRDRLVWIGEQAPEALPGIYAACDLYVWPAVNEAYGMAFIEAQAAGLPVIAGDIPDISPDQMGGVRNVVHAPDAGILTPCGDSAAFTSAVAAMLDNAENRTKMAKRAQQYTLNRHGLEGAAQKLGALLREVTA